MVKLDLINFVTGFTFIQFSSCLILNSNGAFGNKYEIKQLSSSFYRENVS